MTSESIKTKAKYWYDQGFSVIPTKTEIRKSKAFHKPLEKWDQYQTALMAPGEFESQRWDQADGFSVILGKTRSGKFLVCIDFDDKKGLGLWRDEDFKDMGTYVEKTPNHGYHVFLLSDLEVQIDENFENVDFLSSKHLANMYSDLVVDKPILSIQDASITFKEIIQHYNLKPKANRNTKFLDIETLLSHGVAEGERDNTAILLASKLRAQKRTFEEVRDILLSWNLKNTPPLPDQTILEKVTSAFKTRIPYYKKSDVTIEKRARVFRQLMQEHVFICLPNQQLFIYEDGIYKARGLPEQTIGLAIVNEFGDDYQRIDFEQVLSRIKLSVPVAESYFDNVPLNLICLQNGILDINTLELQPHTPSVPFLNKLPIRYDPKATCPLIDKALSEWLESNKHIETILEFFGFCLYRNYLFEKAFFLVGEGENGKTTFLNLLIKFLGEDNVSHVPMQELGDNFKTALSYGKLANVADELSTQALRDSSKFKEMTGRSRIKGDVKFHQDPIYFVNYAKLLFVANQLPETTDTSYAFYRRPQIFNFDRVFSKENGKRDNNLLDKLTTDTELSGLLNKALVGLKRLLDNKGFTIETDSHETQAIWTVDIVKDFTESMLVPDLQSEISLKQLSIVFNEFCKKRSQVPLSDQILLMKLRKYILFKQSRPMVKGIRTRFYQGIRIRTSEQDENLGGFVDA
ncbi:MAG: phage/plasmid primase, P4 family [Candidatus Bathyarchaeia archaeon]